MNDSKIDLVFLWVDGSDPKWIEKKSKFDKNVVTPSLETSSECRFIDNDELRYTLRSVEKNAPWINHIFIVTDNQTPEWLDTSNPRISVVDHTAILPNEVLPLFNSAAIEWGIVNIPNLSEHFIYGNDDTFIIRPVEKSFFFTDAGAPIIRMRRRIRLYYMLKKHSNYAVVIYRAIRRVRRDFGVWFAMTPHHCIDAYTRSVFLECAERYRDEVDRTLTSRFRDNGDLQRAIISLYAIVASNGIARWVDKFNGVSGFWNRVRATLRKEYSFDSLHLPINSKDYKAILRRKNPTLVCMNDNHHSTDSDRVRANEFMKELFPKPSQFER